MSSPSRSSVSWLMCLWMEESMGIDKDIKLCKYWWLFSSAMMIQNTCLRLSSSRHEKTTGTVWHNVYNRTTMKLYANVINTFCTISYLLNKHWFHTFQYYAIMKWLCSGNEDWCLGALTVRVRKYVRARWRPTLWCKWMWWGARVPVTALSSACYRLILVKWLPCMELWAHSPV